MIIIRVTIGQLLALHAIVSTSRAPGRQRLLDVLHDALEAARATQGNPDLSFAREEGES